ncbi:MAG: hypothetical protein M1834_008058 [Cirrosporium novae-zelandiae]|nr:MAG: hypothetical protein M1834_008058 [Cirrosporium novae-zelandiae]
MRSFLCVSKFFNQNIYRSRQSQLASGIVSRLLPSFGSFRPFMHSASALGSRILTEFEHGSSTSCSCTECNYKTQSESDSDVDMDAVFGHLYILSQSGSSETPKVEAGYDSGWFHDERECYVKEWGPDSEARMDIQRWVDGIVEDAEPISPTPYVFLASKEDLHTIKSNWYCDLQPVRLGECHHPYGSQSAGKSDIPEEQEDGEPSDDSLRYGTTDNCDEDSQSTSFLSALEHSYNSSSGSSSNTPSSKSTPPLTPTFDPRTLQCQECHQDPSCQIKECPTHSCSPTLGMPALSLEKTDSGEYAYAHKATYEPLKIVLAF